MLEFIHGWTYAVWFAVYFAFLLLHELAKWLGETRRWHIVGWLAMTLMVLAIALPLTSKATAGSYDHVLSAILESILFGFTVWFIHGGIEKPDEPGVTRKRFFQRRVDPLDGISASMAKDAANRRKARARQRQGVHRKPFFWTAFERVFGKKDDDMFRW